MPGPAKRPAKVAELNGRRPGYDSGGRPIEEPPAFARSEPDKPSDLGPEASRLWDSVTPELMRLELLKPSDAPMLIALCETWERYVLALRMRREKGIVAPDRFGQMKPAPWVAVEAQAASQLAALASQFGLSPSAETKLGGGKKDVSDEDNPFAFGA